MRLKSLLRMPYGEARNVSKLVYRGEPWLLLALLSALTGCIFLNAPNVKAALTVIQPSNADSTILEDSPDENMGNFPFIDVTPWPDGKHRALVKFDLSPIPLGSIVNQASLMLYYYSFGVDGNNPEGRTLNAYRVTKDWVEMEVTWNDYKTGSPWTTRGGDYTEEGASSSTVPNNPGVWMVWDVTSIVKAWIEGGQPNYGFLIKDQGEDANLYMSISFWSKEYSEVPNLQPTLKVDWSPPTTTINTITTTTTTTTATTTTPPSKRPPYPVGGVLTPVSKLAILAPYMALIGLAAVVALVVKKRKR